MKTPFRTLEKIGLKVNPKYYKKEREKIQKTFLFLKSGNIHFVVPGMISKIKKISESDFNT